MFLRRYIKNWIDSNQENIMRSIYKLDGLGWIFVYNCIQKNSSSIFIIRYASFYRLRYVTFHWRDRMPKLMRYAQRIFYILNKLVMKNCIFVNIYSYFDVNNQNIEWTWIYTYHDMHVTHMYHRYMYKTLKL